MTSITFDAVADKGTIRIPDKYISQIGSNVRVVLFPAKLKTNRKSGVIPFYGFDTSEYHFDREEVNDR